MLAKVISCAIVGLDAEIVEVEVDVTQGGPFFTLVGQLTGLTPLDPYTLDVSEVLDRDLTYAADFADIMGQEHVKRAMEVAAAGGHNVLMSWTTNPCIYPDNSNYMTSMES